MSRTSEIIKRDLNRVLAIRYEITTVKKKKTGAFHNITKL